MNAALQVGIAGIAAWTPGAPDWPTLRGVLRGKRDLAADAPTRPGAALLGSERRRAPEGVRLAAEVAGQACTMAALAPSTLPCVFASTYGELAITDYVCETLAHAPLELSPTRFHNSVLNAPAGHWTIATGCTEASSAVSAYQHTFAAGLLEAVTLACSEATPVLFACGDTASTGPLAEMTRTTLAFGVALVLVPGRNAGPRFRATLRAGTATAPPSLALPLQRVAGDNPVNAQALSLLAALAGMESATLELALSPALSLDMEITP